LRYLLALGGLLLGIAAIAVVWMLLPRSGPSLTVTATAQEQAPSASTADPESDEGSLRVCNETANTVSIALGYKAARGWQSEGWWVADAGACKTVYNGRLDARYYYLYAADDISGGAWEGKFFLCTRDETFTIFGVEDCLARGYERTGFFEIDTQNRSNWMVQLTDANRQGVEPVHDTGDAPPLEGELDAGADDGEPAPEDDTDAEGAEAQ
jgi:uncharacterized membrane protein